MKIVSINPDNPDVLNLLRQSDEYMASLYPPESNHMESVADLKKPNVTFFCAILGGIVAGCGGVKLLSDGEGYGEIKRLFVADDFRGKGVATGIISHLEKHLARSAIGVVRLEVGISQPSAIVLYTRLGYTKRAPFGNYRADPLSVFMEKRLDNAHFHA